MIENMEEKIDIQNLTRDEIVELLGVSEAQIWIVTDDTSFGGVRALWVNSFELRISQDGSIHIYDIEEDRIWEGFHRLHYRIDSRFQMAYSIGFTDCGKVEYAIVRPRT